MDKPSEQKKDAKARSDTDIGIHDYGAGGKRQQLNGLWSFTTITGGSREQRLVNQCYGKAHHAAYEKDKGNLDHTIGQTIDRIATHGEGLENTSKPRIVAAWPQVRGKL